jgi:hypothetical protein
MARLRFQSRHSKNDRTSMAAITPTSTHRIPHRIPHRFRAPLVGATFGLFALAALAAALLLEGPQTSESPYLLATAPALAGARLAVPAPLCARCGVVEAVTAVQRETTLFHVTLRMADGSLHQLALTQPLATGQRVHLAADGRITVLADEGAG